MHYTMFIHSLNTRGQILGNYGLFYIKHTRHEYLHKILLDLAISSSSSVCPSVSVYVCICVSVPPFLRLSVRLSVRPSVHPSARPSVCISSSDSLSCWNSVMWWTELLSKNYSSLLISGYNTKLNLQVYWLLHIWLKFVDIIKMKSHSDTCSISSVALLLGS